MYYAKAHGRNQYKFFGDGNVLWSGDYKTSNWFTLSNLGNSKAVSARWAHIRPHSHIRNIFGWSFHPPTSNCWSAEISFLLSNRSSGTVHNAPPSKLKQQPFKTVPEPIFRTEPLMKFLLPSVPPLNQKNTIQDSFRTICPASYCHSGLIKFQISKGPPQKSVLPEPSPAACPASMHHTPPQSVLHGGSITGNFMPGVLRKRHRHWLIWEREV